MLTIDAKTAYELGVASREKLLNEAAVFLNQKIPEVAKYKTWYQYPAHPEIVLEVTALLREKGFTVDVQGLLPNDLIISWPKQRKPLRK